MDVQRSVRYVIRSRPSALAIPTLCALLTLFGCSEDTRGTPGLVANGDHYSIGVSQTLTVPAPGVLANDSSTRDEALNATLISAPAFHAGTFVLNADGSFAYVHNGNDAISDSFTYQVNSGSATSTAATVSITVNQSPVAANTCATTPAGQMLSGTLPGYDPNPADHLVFSLGGVTPFKGTVSLDVSGNFTYAPRTDLPSGDGRARGMDVFSYRVTDGDGLQSNEGLATVLIDGAVRIMPLGDSITAGVSYGLPQNLQVGYRQKLFADLTALSLKYAVDFVGRRNLEGTDTSLADRDHEGHPGWCDDNNPHCDISGGKTIDDDIATILHANPPDSILLHIGTNEFGTDSSGVNSILNKISVWAQANHPVNVFVARIIPSVNANLAVTAFNDNVQSIATARPGVKTFIVDQQSQLRLAGDPNPDKADPNLMADNLHPNQVGYERMAERWRDELIAQKVLPVCQ